MPQNRVTAVLSVADQQEVMTAINTIREKMPFLIDLTPEERRSLPKMGDKSRAFVVEALTVAAQNEDILPRSFDLEEMRKDLHLLQQLEPVRVALTQLTELIDDTYMELGSESYTAALAVYNYMRAAGRGQALDGMLDALGQRFARKTVQAPPTAPQS